MADWQKDLIDECLREHEANPDAEVPWREVRARLLEKYLFQRSHIYTAIPKPANVDELC